MQQSDFDSIIAVGSEIQVSLRDIGRQIATLRRMVASEDEAEWVDDSLSDLHDARNHCDFTVGSLERALRKVSKEREAQFPTDGPRPS